MFASIECGFYPGSGSGHLLKRALIGFLERFFLDGAPASAKAGPKHFALFFRQDLLLKVDGNVASCCINLNRKAPLPLARSAQDPSPGFGV